MFLILSNFWSYYLHLQCRIIHFHTVYNLQNINILPPWPFILPGFPLENWKMFCTNSIITFNDQSFCPWNSSTLGKTCSTVREKTLHMVMENATSTAKNRPLKESACKHYKYVLKSRIGAITLILLPFRRNFQWNFQCKVGYIAKLMNSHIVPQSHNYN